MNFSYSGCTMIGIHANVDIRVLHIDMKRHEGTLRELLTRPVP